MTASQGLMVESINPDLVVHQGSPTKHPDVRLECIRTAGELRIPFTTGILVGIGETPGERVDALRAIGYVQRQFGHVQEVILQNFRGVSEVRQPRRREDRRRIAARRTADD